MVVVVMVGRGGVRENGKDVKYGEKAREVSDSGETLLFTTANFCNLSTSETHGLFPELGKSIHMSAPLLLHSEWTSKLGAEERKRQK